MSDDFDPLCLIDRRGIDRGEEVAAMMEKWIADGTLPPGSRLIPPASLASCFDITTTVMARVLRILVRRGLVEHARGSREWCIRARTETVREHNLRYRAAVVDGDSLP